MNLISTTKSTHQNVSEHYNLAYPVYKIWNKENMHMALWDIKTQNFQQALTNVNRLLIKYMNIQRSDRILDVGAGFGGTAISIAQATGADVTAINISNRQLVHAQNLLNKYSEDLQSHVRFQYADFVDVPFADESFTGLYAIEAACHIDKVLFVKQASRLLKKAGRLGIIDVFCDPSRLPLKLRKIYQRLLQSWYAPQHLSGSQFVQLLEDHDFQASFFDLTPAIQKTLPRTYILGTLMPLWLQPLIQITKSPSLTEWLNLVLPGKFFPQLYKNINFRYGFILGIKQ